MTDKIKIYVGRTSFALVLKYSTDGICRYYPRSEELTKTVSYLRVEFPNNNIEFCKLIDKDKAHGIRPVNDSELEKLSLAYKEVK
jgi:hypothetical protein